MMFREDQGGNPEIVRESQRRRYADVSLVDKVIELDTAARKSAGMEDTLGMEYKKVMKQVAEKKKAKIEEGVADLIAESKTFQLKREKQKEETERLRVELKSVLGRIGNIVHDSVPVSDDEANNAVLRTWNVDQQLKNTGNLIDHFDLMAMIDGYDQAKGSAVAGHRGYFLKGPGVLLNQALIQYGLSFLMSKGYTPLQTPFMMKKEIMAETAQLEQFDEELYKVSGDGEDKYLIATSEQPISAYYRGDWIEPQNLPERFAGYSTCFRKEAGSHGKQTLGLFRIRQFEKVEQFVVCSPNNNESWDEHERMTRTAEEFLISLELPHRVVKIVSGELNNAAASKNDIEAWFPTQGVYGELVSSSNCTDYQSRNLEVRYGSAQGKQAPGVKASKQYVHMLNATLCATERTLCCVIENYQEANGIRVPKVLQPYMGGMDFIPFKYARPIVKKGSNGVRVIPGPFKPVEETK